MASDYDEAKEHIKDFFEEQEDIVNAIATVIRDAIANLDAVPEIPEESSGWNWTSSRRCSKPRSNSR